MNSHVNTKTVLGAERASQLALDQLELALQGFKVRAWVRPVIAIALAFVFSRWVAWPRLVSWCALALVCSILPLLTERNFLARPVSCARSGVQWQRLFCLSHGFYAAAWTTLAYFMWIPENDFNHGMIMMALGCSVSAVVPIFGACRPLSFTVFAIFGSGFLGATLLGGTPDYQAFSLVITVYLLLLFFILRQVHASTTKTLLLGYENCDLLIGQRSLSRELVIAKQIAEQKCIEAELANQSKSQFLANMSHELRTPLNAIIGFSEIIKSRILGDDISRNVEYATLIHGSGMHLLTLINDILDLAKIESGGLTLVEKNVVLNAVIVETVALLQHRAREGRCTLTGATEIGLPAVRADERALKQILLNLLSNALKFTLPGGTVKAFARKASDGQIAFGVTDTGVGIAPEDQAKVFEKFGQGRHAHVSKEKGTGLGLSIVRGLVHAHGGEIVLESVEHQGTTVTVTIPANRIMWEDANMSSPRSQSGAARPTR